MRYSAALLNSCDTWQALVRSYAAAARQILDGSVTPTATAAAAAQSSAPGPLHPPALRLVGYSFGCRLAYAVGRLLAEEGAADIELVLLDGPIGGARGAIEEALLGSGGSHHGGSNNGGSDHGRKARVAEPTNAHPTAEEDEMAVARGLVEALTQGGEGPPAPLGGRARVSLFVASDDEVGVDLASQHLPHVPVRRVHSNHRGLLHGRAAQAVAELICGTGSAPDGAKEPRGAHGGAATPGHG